MLPDLKYLKVLELSKLNGSEQALTKLAEIITYNLPLLRVLDISSNPINYFTFDSLSFAFKSGKTNLQTLNLSNTHLTEKNAIDLMDSILSFSKLKNLDISRNMDLGYKFSAYLLVMLKNIEGYQL